MKIAGLSFFKISYLSSSSNLKLSIVCFQAPFLFQAPPDIRPLTKIYKPRAYRWQFSIGLKFQRKACIYLN